MDRSRRPLAPADLAAALAQIEPSARLVARRLVRRVIRRHRKTGGFLGEAPHEHGYPAPREEIARIVPPAELDLRGTADTVLLLATPDDVDERSPEEALADLWRTLFEVRVLAVLDELRRRGVLSARAAREHIHRLGQTEADEVRATLRKERLLLPPLPGETREQVTWACFAAHWAELEAFEPAALGRVFPTLAPRRDEVTALVCRSVDLPALLEASRPTGAPDLAVARALYAPRETAPSPPKPAPAPTPTEQRRLLALAAEARTRGNLVRAALLCRDAAPEQATADLRALGLRLEAALERDPPDPESWSAALRPLLARSGLFAPEGRLLYELQKACVDHEREVHRIDLVEWALSLGRRPIRRALPALREVRVARHLRSAQHRAASLRLPGDEAHRLHERLEAAADEREAHLRKRLRPLLEEPISAAVPEATTRVERAAVSKVVEELLDRVAEKGSISFPHVRDAVARNQAKLADLGGPRNLVRDPLLRLDRDLSAPLEGVYRRAEFYRRWLQRLSALAFGTSAGRWITRLALLPAAGAFLALEGLQHTVGLLFEKLAHLHIPFVSLPALVGVGLLILALVNSATARAIGLAAARAVGRALRWLFVDVPRWIAARSWVQRMLASAAWRGLWSHVLKPSLWTAPPAATLWLTPLPASARWALSGALWLAFAVFLNTAPGRRLAEGAADGLVRVRRWLAHRFVPALVRWILAFFRTLVDGLERALFAVDEALRFRPGDRSLGVAAKAILALPWGAVTYLLRLYVNVLLEPKYNPVKHFPVVTVAHKIILPMSFTLTDALSRPLLFLGPTAAKGVAATTVFLLPGLFGFLAWELKENWRLYRRNRPDWLRPVIVGPHGETVLRLLRPGFHSGTLPKLFAKLRRAARRRSRIAHDRALHRLEERLHHVEVEVRRFVERELLALVNPAAAPAPPLCITGIDLASNRIRIHLDGVAVSLEEQSGFLVGALHDEQGLLGGWPASRRAAFEAGLEGLYHLAGVHFVREEIERLLPDGAAYDIADEGLVVWVNGGETEAVYPLDQRPLLSPRGAGAGALAPLPRTDLFFSERPMAWETWVRRWERGGGAGPAPGPRDGRSGIMGS